MNYFDKLNYFFADINTNFMEFQYRKITFYNAIRSIKMLGKYAKHF